MPDCGLPDIISDDYFLGYVDIAGFRNLMRRNSAEALRALDRFYQFGYNEIENQIGHRKPIVGQFFSDSGLLIALNQDSRMEQLRKLLGIICNLNKKMYKEGKFLLTTSVVYGQFKHQKRVQSESIGKVMVYGKGFVQAYFNQTGLKPG